MKSALSSHLVRSIDPPVQVKNLVRVEYIIYRISLVGLDLVLTYLAFQAAYTIRFHTNLSFFNSDSIIPQVPFYHDYMLLAIPIWVIIFALMGLYRTKNILGGTQEYSLVFNATTACMFSIISLGFLFPENLFLARGWVILAWFFTFLFTAAGRFLSRRLVYAFRRKGHFQFPALLIGVNHEGQLLVEQFQHWPTSGVRLVGYVNPGTDHTLEGKLRWLGTIDDLDRLIKKHDINEIILTSSALQQDEILMLFRKYGTAKDINVSMTSGLYEMITTGMQIKEDGLVPLLTINKVRMTGLDQTLKLMMDYLISIPAILVLLPLYLLVALAVRLDSPGPIIHRRRVMGVNGHQFDAFKFRTMYENGDEILRSHPELLSEYQENFKLKNDPRITRVGKFIRKNSIDELPQLFNVLRNEMSIVGPRMICPEELSKYQQWDINLLTVKPGITGMWQVRGRSDVGYEERVKLDMLYIRNWTAWLDIKLLIQTIPAVLTKRGAY
jgi:exopolysaccharide biosynthesis polyprenyl glycosylphosphotransferase